MTSDNWHGFSNLVQFLKATVSLGLTVTACVWALLVLTLDTRYVMADDMDAIVVELKAYQTEKEIQGLERRIAVTEDKMGLASERTRRGFETELRLLRNDLEKAGRELKKLRGEA